MVYLVLLVMGIGFTSLLSISFLFKSLSLFCLIFFTSSTLFAFFIRLELTIVPIVLMIFFWGLQPEKIRALYYFLLYTLIRRFPFIFVLRVFEDTFNLFMLKETRRFLTWCVVLTFIVKFPLFGFHLWLPKAHTEAPTLGSVVLAGLLLKLGGYGLNFVLFSLFSYYTLGFVLFSLFGRVCSGVVSSLQRDSKVYVAYSSVTHINLTFFILTLFLSVGKNTSYLIILTHGVTASFMFWFMGLSYYFCFSRFIYFNGSVQRSFYCLVLLLFFSNFRIPPLLGVFQEVLFLRSLFSFSFLLVGFLFFYLVLVMYYNIYLGVLFLLKGNRLYVSFCCSVSVLFSFVLFMFNYFILVFVFCYCSIVSISFL